MPAVPGVSAVLGVPAVPAMSGESAVSAMSGVSGVSGVSGRICRVGGLGRAGRAGSIDRHGLAHADPERASFVPTIHQTDSSLMVSQTILSLSIRQHSHCKSD